MCVNGVLHKFSSVCSPSLPESLPIHHFDDHHKSRENKTNLKSFTAFDDEWRKYFATFNQLDAPIALKPTWAIFWPSWKLCLIESNNNSFCPHTKLVQHHVRQARAYISFTIFKLSFNSKCLGKCHYCTTIHLFNSPFNASKVNFFHFSVNWCTHWTASRV